MPASEPPSVLLFADGIDLIIGIVVVLVTIIGWLVNLINENAKKKPARPVNQAAGAPRADDRFQQEIDEFLQQVGGKPQQRRPVEKPIELAPVDIEVVPQRELWEREREEQRQRELSTLAGRHVETQINNNIGEQVRRDIDVEADLGTGTPAPSVRRPASARVQPTDIVQMLRDRDGVRKAIIVNEILQRRTSRR